MKLTQKDYDSSSNKIPTCSRCKKPMKPFINGSYTCWCGADFTKIKASGTGGGSNKMKKYKHTAKYYRDRHITHLESQKFIIGNIDLENKLIRANKRADKWRKREKVWHDGVIQYYESSHKDYLEIKKMEKEVKFWHENANIDHNKFIEANLKQKKAWIAFYITTILYIVGILVLI